MNKNMCMFLLSSHAKTQGLPEATVESCVFDNAHASAMLIDGTGNQSINVFRSAFYRSYNASTIVVNAGGVVLRGNIVVGTTREGAPWGPTDRHVPASFDYNGDDVARVSVWPCKCCLLAAYGLLCLRWCLMMLWGQHVARTQRCIVTVCATWMDSIIELL